MTATQLTTVQPDSAASGGERITVSRHLMQRLQECGIGHFFGVPGDFILPFYMQHQTDPQGLHYIGTCNELDAGYAADGYARLRGMGAVVVTYGPGSFSVLNAVAAAWAEDIALVLITGGPARAAYADQRFAHHMVPENYAAGMAMFAPITAGTFLLNDPATAAAQIDAALCLARDQRKPVYLEIPSDIQVEMIAASRTPLPAPVPAHSAATIALAHELVRRICAGERTVLIPGHEIHRFELREKMITLAANSGLPVASLWYGKSDYLEYLPNCIGGYQGGATLPALRDYIESADQVVFLGALETDFNLGGYTHSLTPQQAIWVRRGAAIVDGSSRADIHLPQLLDLLLELLPAQLMTPAQLPPKGFLFSASNTFVAQPAQPLTDRRLYDRLAHFIRPDDIVTVDGGAAYNSVQFEAPRGTDWLYSVYWASIGHGFGTTLGAVMAADNQRRVVAMTGDGSFQMTALEVSNFVRFKKSVVIFVVNNQGYTAERLIMDGEFNDIAGWRYHKLPEAFGGGRGIEVRTEGELEEAIAVAEAWVEPAPLLIEVHLDPLDASDCFKILAETLRSKA